MLGWTTKAQPQAAGSSPELQLLFYCAQTRITVEITERIHRLLQGDINWEYLMGMAMCHRVMPLLSRNLSQLCPEMIPSAVLSQFRTLFHVNASHNFSLTLELLRILEVFQDQGILAIPFKGPILATSAYGDLTLRQSGDLDLLVHESNYSAARDCIIDLGYKLQVQVPWECHLLSENRPFNIDLHRVVVPQHLCFPLTSMDMWKNLKLLNLLHRTVLTFSPETLLLILCLNGNKECWQSLNRLCDINELIHAHPTLNWDQFLQNIRTLGFSRLIFSALLLIYELFNTPLPESVLRQAKTNGAAVKICTQVHRKLFTKTLDQVTSVGEIERTLFHVRSRERFWDKVQSTLGLMAHSGWMTPSQNDRKFFPLPPALFFLYYLLRPIRIIQKYGLTFLQ